MRRFHGTRLATLTALLLLAGCAPKAIRVRCDAHLVPINPPTTAASGQGLDERHARPSSKGVRP